MLTTQVTYVERVVPSLTDEIDVFVKCDWKLSRRFDALARADKVYLDCARSGVGPFIEGFLDAASLDLVEARL